MNIPDQPIQKAMNRPWEAVKYAFNEILSIPEYHFSRIFGWQPFQHDWDVLIILDACRFDVATEQETSLGPPERVYSLGANSPRWIQRSFQLATETQLNSTGYISANPFTNLAPDDKLAFVDNVLQYAFDKELGTVPPRPVTDRAIEHIRAGHADRYIVHYIQPHLPSVQEDGEVTEFISPPDMEASTSNPWKDVESGVRDSNEVINAYKNNLSPVIDEVELLLENINAEMVSITADHGNYLGEFGRYGHRYDCGIHPAVRFVPYWEKSATDRQTHDPKQYNHKSGNVSRNERLEALGYK